jgi:Domain of unknown function (DUF4136)
MYPPGPDISFAILPFRGQSGDLEFSTYSSLVADHLSRLGYTKVNDLAHAQILVALGYSINGRTFQSEAPVFGRTGGGSAIVSGNVNGQGFSGLVSSPETYGAVGTTTVTGREFTRDVVIIMFDARKSTQTHTEEIFRAEGVSIGSSSSLPVVMPNIIDAIFNDFPGKNGEAISVTSHVSR